MNLTSYKIKGFLQISVLVFICFLGIFFRTYHLSSNPAGFFCDEAAFGYNAYTILTTGKDEFGNTLPIFFKSFGEYKDPLQVYSTVPFIGLFGLNEFATRLPSAIYGIITIIVLYFIGKQMKNKSFGILVALIAATMPWLIHYSRVAFELACYTAFFTLTISLFLRATTYKSFLIPAFIVGGLTLYTYQPAKLLVVLLLLGLLFIYRKNYFKHKREITIGFICFFLLSLPMIISIFTGEFAARFAMVSLFSAHLSLQKTILLFIHNYFIQLSPGYLIYGEPTFITRHFTGGLSPLLATTLPFLFIGILHTLFTLKNKSSQLLFYWLLIYPIAGAVTAEAPFTSRSIIGAPLFAIFISSGIIVSFSWIKNKIVTYILISLFALTVLNNVSLFTQFYFFQYPVYSADFWGWQYGPKDIMRYFTTHTNNYTAEFMEPDVFNAPDIFLKFYAPKGCSKCQLGTPSEKYNAKQKQLFAVTPSYITAHKEFVYKPVENIYYPDRSVAFVLAEVKQK